jgi:hypothetical protein
MRDALYLSINCTTLSVRPLSDYPIFALMQVIRTPTDEKVFEIQKFFTVHTLHTDRFTISLPRPNQSTPTYHNLRK